MRNLVYSFIALAICFVHGYENGIVPSKIRARISEAYTQTPIPRNTIRHYAAENQFPYAISLQHLSPDEQKSDTRGHRCGGALISFRHALTSASCLHETVHGNSHPSVIRPDEYRVFAGSIRLTNDKASTTQPTPDTIRMIASVAIHPGYTGAPAFFNDIGVITLVTPFAEATVTPLSLPAADFRPAEFAPCQAAGWGAPQNPETVNTTLWYSNTYVYNQLLCTVLYKWLYATRDIFCAASIDIPPSSCVPDDGNALVCNYTLAGIFVGHSDCSSTSHPELYTCVSNYTTWIRSVSASPVLFTPAVFVMTALFSITQIFLN